jgi:hypothetical protein
MNGCTACGEAELVRVLTSGKYLRHTLPASDGARVRREGAPVVGAAENCALNLGS